MFRIVAMNLDIAMNTWEGYFSALAEKGEPMAKIKAKYVGMVTMNFEIDENEPGVCPFETIKENANGLNNAIGEILSYKIGGSLSVEQLFLDVWRAEDGH